jgi:hypothetical protein
MVKPRIIAAIAVASGTFGAFAASAAQSQASPAAWVATVKSTMEWAFGYTPSYTKILRLTVMNVPSGGVVAVKCTGHGCPFRSRTVSVSHERDVALGGLFHGAHLYPGARIKVSVTAPNEVGKVWVLTVLSGQPPSVSVR